jgi:hypothetical protein
MASPIDNQGKSDGPDVRATFGAHTWRLSCAPGEESALIGALIDLARRADAPLSWIEAATLFCQLQRPGRDTQTTDGSKDGTRRADAPHVDSQRPSAARSRSTTTP